MQCCFTFDYFIQFLYLKTNAIDLPKKTKKWKSLIILFVSLLYCIFFVLLLVVRSIILIFFIVIWQYSFSLNILNRTETVTLKLWYKPNCEKVEPYHP